MHRPLSRAPRLSTPETPTGPDPAQAARVRPPANLCGLSMAQTSRAYPVPACAGLAAGYLIRGVERYGCFESGVARDWELVGPSGEVVPIDSEGKVRVRLRVRGQTVSRIARKLAALSYPGLPTPPDHNQWWDTRPRNGDPRDEDLANLRWRTTPSNEAPAYTESFEVPETLGLAPGHRLIRVEPFNCETGALRDWMLLAPSGEPLPVDGLGMVRVLKHSLRVGGRRIKVLVSSSALAASCLPWLPTPGRGVVPVGQWKKPLRPETVPRDGDRDNETLENLQWDEQYLAAAQRHAEKAEFKARWEAGRAVSAVSRDAGLAFPPVAFSRSEQNLHVSSV